MTSCLWQHHVQNEKFVQMHMPKVDQTNSRKLTGNKTLIDLEKYQVYRSPIPGILLGANITMKREYKMVKYPQLQPGRHHINQVRSESEGMPRST